MSTLGVPAVTGPVPCLDGAYTFGNRTLDYREGAEGSGGFAFIC